MQKDRNANIFRYESSRGVVGRERVGTAFPHLFHVLLEYELEAVKNCLFFGCVPTPFLLALYPWRALGKRNQ